MILALKISATVQTVTEHPERTARITMTKSVSLVSPVFFYPVMYVPKSNAPVYMVALLQIPIVLLMPRRNVLLVTADSI